MNKNDNNLADQSNMEEDTQPSIISSTLTQELKIKDGHTSMNEVNTIDDSCIKDENMVALGELGVKVFDQISLETGIAEQIEFAIEAEEERIRKKKESQEGKKKAIKKVPKKKTSADDGNEDSEVEKEEIAVANSADVLEDFSEVDEKIKLGEMTPFGTVLESSKMFVNDKEQEHEEISDIPSDFLDSDPEYIPDEEESDKIKRTRSFCTHLKQEAIESDEDVWESSEEEHVRRPLAREKKKKKKVVTAIDDGDLLQYNRRIADWQASKEHDIKGYEEFEGGFKMPYKIWKQLFAYQRIGVRWLWELYSEKCGGILGDEMGLGKTVQIVAFLAGIAYSNLYDKQLSIRGLGPVLIVTPTTVMYQWVREFHTWWPPARVAILHQSGSHVGGRPVLIRSIVGHKGVLITSYAGVVQYKDELLRHNWHFVILDEGHKIRNPDSQATLAVKQFRTPYRIILSGSPIQNNLKELWSLFDFVFPGKLGTLPVFMQQFAVPITIGGYANASKLEVAAAYKCACILRDTINPYLLRRQKADVKKHLSLPEKSEQVLFCKLTDEQRQLYRMYIDSKEVSRIVEGRALAFLGLTNLRKICNHPDLFPNYNEEFRDMTWDSPTRECDWKRSGKMIVVESLLRIWKKQGHRVLLFSQSKKMLDIFEKFVRSMNYTYLRLDGSTSIGARQPLIDKFNSNNGIFLFLLTTRVGGLGVNLTGANRVIIYDPDWNPMTDVQARERSWRIGQRKDVTIFRLLTSGTIEEKIYHRQIFKQFLTNKVLKDPKQRRFFKSTDLFSLFTLTEGEKEGTETGAIFAGTGSELFKPRKKKRKAEEEEEREKMPKKKKKRAKIDGEVIENVEKKSSYKSEAERETEKMSEEQQNEYVLHRLFKKSGLQSAMQHDVIMESTGVDLELIEAEAEKVAKDAALHLKQSKRECFSASSGIPTWTGSHGSKKPRFGTKQNTQIRSAVPPKPLSAVKSEEKKRAKKPDSWDFNSIFKEETKKRSKKKISRKLEEKASSSKESKDGKPLTSREILEKIRERNRLVGTLDDQAIANRERPRFRRRDAESEEEVEELVPVLQEDDPNLELLREIRNYLLFAAPEVGEATTEDITNEFKDKLPLGNAPLFRALLHEICEFSKEEGRGLWKILPEFR